MQTSCVIHSHQIRDLNLPDDRLPPRLFATDRYPICRLNVYSKPDTLTVVRHLLRDSPELDRILNSSFGGLFHLPANRAPISCKLIQALIARQLVTKQKYELWTVFGGQPLRFSLPEFQDITGLNCSLFDEGYETPSSEVILKEPDIYWRRWIGDDVKTTCADIASWLRDDKEMPGERRIRLALLLIVDCVLIANHQTHTPTPRYVRMVDNLEEFFSFPWGRESFLKTVWSMRPPRVTGPKSKDGPVSLFCKQLQQKSIKLNGFPLVLQLLAFRAIPALLDKLPDPSDRLRILDCSSEGFPNNAAVTLNDVLDSENDCNLVVMPLNQLPPNPADGSGEWDDEVIDRKVKFMLSLIKDNHVFSKENWPGGDDSCPILVHQPWATRGSHKKHILNRRKGKATTKQVVLPDSPAEQLHWLATHVAQLSYVVNSSHPDSQRSSKRTRSTPKKQSTKVRTSKRRRLATPTESPSVSSDKASIRLDGDHILDSPNKSIGETSGPRSPIPEVTTSIIVTPTYQRSRSHTYYLPVLLFQYSQPIIEDGDVDSPVSSSPPYISFIPL
ncbi:hypothetical protein EUTSA_v10002316mg [Eutrema salsugineum]|uniref:DUF1985 domain-containing protein n=1 Tax=Eutrema salsugineum TaxID=72664 RepID=V4M291_EUTSA|nr:hypothetical protein EUTSA_v10002316mg [Eutrema salsugineum]